MKSVFKSYLCVMNTIFHLSQYARQALKDSYPEHEIQSICRIIYMDVLHFTNIDIHIKKNETLDESFVNKFHSIIQRLQQNEPLQYILGETTFAGLQFKVNRSTLIPRPETEELVRWVTGNTCSGMHVLDIGTGSGCIAVSIAHLCPQAVVCAIDIAQDTLETAQENALINQTDVTFMARDILHYDNYKWNSFDIIVSNPPYIRECEKKEMHKNVLEYEPARALFVNDTDPLLFYRTITEFGQHHLKPGGLLFFEINEAFGKETVDLLAQKGYKNIELRKDFFEKERMIKASK